VTYTAKLVTRDLVRETFWNYLIKKMTLSLKIAFVLAGNVNALTVVGKTVGGRSDQRQAADVTSDFSVQVGKKSGKKVAPKAKKQNDREVTYNDKQKQAKWRKKLPNEKTLLQNDPTYFPLDGKIEDRNVFQTKRNKGKQEKLKVDESLSTYEKKILVMQKQIVNYQDMVDGIPVPVDNSGLHASDKVDERGNTIVPEPIAEETKKKHKSKKSTLKTNPPKWQQALSEKQALSGIEAKQSLPGVPCTVPQLDEEVAPKQDVAGKVELEEEEDVANGFEVIDVGEAKQDSKDVDELASKLEGTLLSGDSSSSNQQQVEQPTQQGGGFFGMLRRVLSRDVKA